MLIRLGYACICTTLDNITTSSTYTYTNFIKEQNYQKLDNIIKSNLNALIEVLTFNAKNNIHFYRLSSNIIPLATHPNLNFDYLSPHQENYKKIAKLINKHHMRVDLHPSTYCILNSTKKEVVDNSIKILIYHYNLLKNMQIKNKLIILHIGSNTFGKKNSLTRFINNFNKLPDYLKQVIAIENDDKTFTIDDCLYLAKILKIKVVLDYHHFLCNHTSSNITDYLPDIFNTWKNTTPKIHFSSPKNKKEYRAHHQYIDSKIFIDFIEILKQYSQNLDIMIEAKGKDEALFKLTRQLKYKTNYTFIDETSFQVK